MALMCEIATNFCKACSLYIVVSSHSYAMKVSLSTCSFVMNIIRSVELKISKFVFPPT